MNGHEADSALSEADSNIPRVKSHKARVAYSSGIQRPIGLFAAKLACLRRR